jgi:hypothetical protein
MAKSIAIISAANEQFYPLLRGLIQSLADQGWTQKADICVIDVGLSPEQRAELKPLTASVIDGQWDIEFAGQANSPRWFQAFIARPQLRVHFPGYEVYFWIDADAWLADGRAMDVFLATVRDKGFALVPEIHSAYRWFYSTLEWEPRANIHRCYSQGWGEAIAKRYASFPVLNAGVIAIRWDHPCWERWGYRLREGLSKTNNLLVEQCALNLAVYLDKVPCGFLPAWCNWVCHQAEPRLNPDRKRFEEPTPPYMPISIVHCTNSTHTLKLIPTGGPRTETQFNYSDLKRAGLI